MSKKMRGLKNIIKNKNIYFTIFRLRIKNVQMY